MKDRKQLEKFILDKLKEIQKEYVDYLNQFDPSQIEGFESSNSNILSNVLSCSVFADSVSAFSIVGEKDDRTVYALSVHSEYGDTVRFSTHKGLKALVLEDLFKKEEEEDGKEDTAE